MTRLSHCTPLNFPLFAIPVDEHFRLCFLITRNEAVIVINLSLREESVRQLSLPST